MRAIDADAISYESIDSCDTGRHEHYYGTGIIAVRKEDIDEMPTIHPEPHWIPVERDTPTEDDDYWCTFDAETGRFVDWCNWYQGRWVVWTDDTVSEVSNVIAWCKPMEPYKGGQHD